MSLRSSLRETPLGHIYHTLRRSPLSKRTKQQRVYDLQIVGNRVHTPCLWFANAVSPRRVRRALLAYIVHPFGLPRDDPLNNQFSNVGIAKGLVQVLNGLGYVVDVVRYDDVDFVPRRHYDLFVGHMGVNFRQIAECLSSETVRVYFASTAYWRYHNDQEYDRIAALERRKGVRLSPDRALSPDEEWALANSDGIVCMGNTATRETYSKFPVVHNVHNASYEDSHAEYSKRDPVNARRKFLFFAGGGTVHKGLDLLLDAFSQLEEHLYICTELDPQFASIYQKELYNRANIHTVGWLQMRTPQFYEVVDECAYTILPSCSEGSPGSIIEGMNQGMIPIVSKASGIDTCDFGVTLSDCSVVEITNVVTDLSQHSVDWVSDMSLRARHAAITRFTESIFLRDMREAIAAILVHPRRSSDRLQGQRV